MQQKERENLDLTDRTKEIGERSSVRANYSPYEGCSLTDHYFSLDMAREWVATHIHCSHQRLLDVLFPEGSLTIHHEVLCVQKCLMPQLCILLCDRNGHNCHITGQDFYASYAPFLMDVYPSCGGESPVYSLSELKMKVKEGL